MTRPRIGYLAAAAFERRCNVGGGKSDVNDRGRASCLVAMLIAAARSTSALTVTPPSSVEQIASYVEVNVERTVKGFPLPNATVRMLGGRLQFPDGVTAEMQPMRGEFVMIPGQRYALFLRVIDDPRAFASGLPDPLYTPIGASQGIVSLGANDGLVSSQARPDLPIRQVVDGQSVSQFLEALPTIPPAVDAERPPPPQPRRRLAPGQRPPIPSQEEMEKDRDDREKDRVILRVHRAGDLHTAAILNGGIFFDSFNPHTETFTPSVEFMGEQSDLVVVGTAAQSTVRLEGTYTQVVSYVTVNVDETLKGLPVQNVTVRVLGGRYRFPDGVTVDSQSGAGEEYGLVPGQRYALFLTLIDDARTRESGVPAPIYAPVNSTDGIFGLSSKDGLVKSQAQASSPLRQLLDNESVSVFLAKLPMRALTPPSR